MTEPMQPQQWSAPKHKFGHRERAWLRGESAVRQTNGYIHQKSYEW